MFADVKQKENSADFHSFKTISGHNAKVKVGSANDRTLMRDILPPQEPGEGPLLLSVGSSMALGPNTDNKAGILDKANSVFY